MKYIAAYISAGLLALTALNGAENAANTTDAALFAGQGNAGIRYYRLGELALENFDAAGAVDFFRLALENLQDENLRLQATDLLLKSLLNANKIADAEEVLAAARKDEIFSNSDILKLMQARILLHKEKNAEAVSMQIKTMIENATYEKMKKELIKGCN